MKYAALILAAASMCLAGTKPRSDASAYKAHETRDGLTIAAEILPADQVKNLFSTDMRGYVVVEVAIYPAMAPPDVTHMDFLLRCGGDQNVRAANPSAISHTIQNAKTAPPPKSSDITIYPTATVGYESGGPYHRGGVYTGGGVGVGVGPQGGPVPPPPASTDRDRATMQAELSDRALPEGSVTKPVAGYIYFPYPASKQKKVAYELEFAAPSGTMRLQLK